MTNSSKRSNILAVTIAKNESAEISGWLDACRRFSSLQLVVDTGSCDNTKELAVAAGASVFDVPWTGDFAAARNAALTAAANHPEGRAVPWIAMLDADEHITPDSAERLTEIVENYTARASADPDAAPEAIAVTIVNVDADDNYIKNREIHRFTAVRVFRNLPRLRYEGKIHEQLYFMEPGRTGPASKRNPRTAVHPEIEVIHTGYSSRRVREKIFRNLELLQSDIAARGEGPRHYRYLADCYLGLENYPEALRYARLAIGSPLSAGSSESDIYSVRLTCMRKLKYPLPEQLAAASEAAEKFPRLPDFAAALGELQLEAKDYLPAIASLEKSLALYADYCRALASGNFAANAPDASFFAAEPPNVHYRLALCQQALGNNDAARQEILTALSARPKTIEYLAAAEEIFGGSFLPEIVIPALEKNPADRQFYFDFAESLGAVKLQAEINDIKAEGAAPLRQTSFQSLPQCIGAARENTDILFLTALELAAAERNEEASAAAAKLCPPAALLVTTLIGGGIEPLLSSPLRDEAADFWSLLCRAVAEKATEPAALQFALLAPAASEEARLAAARLFYEAERWPAAASLYGAVFPASPAFSAGAKAEYLRLILRLMEQDHWPAADTIGLLNKLFRPADYPLICRTVFPLMNRRPALADIYIYYGKKAGQDLSDPLLLLALKNYGAVAGNAAARLSSALRQGFARVLKNEAAHETDRESGQLIRLAGRELQTACQLLKDRAPLPEELAGHPQVKALCRYMEETDNR